MRVLLIRPPVHDFASTPAPALGLGYLASALRQRDVDVQILDLAGPKQRNELRLAYLAWRPDVVGITTMLQDYPAAVSVASEIRGLDADATVLLGGPFASTVPADILRGVRDIDAVIVGEAERTLPQVVASITRPRDVPLGPGVVRRTDSGVEGGVKAPLVRPLDAISAPAWDALHLDWYLAATGVATAISSRGCPAACTFCPTTAFWDYRVRAHSIERFQAELQTLTSTYGFREFYFVDDDLAFDGNRLRELSVQLSKSHVPFEWTCNVRPDHVSADLLSTMRQAGCKRIVIGVETAVDELRERSGKRGVRTELVRTTVRAAKELGIAVKMNMMFGLAGETVEDVDQSVKLVAELDPEQVTYSVLDVYPGTVLARQHPIQGDLGNPRNWSGARGPLKGIETQPSAERIMDVVRSAEIRHGINPNHASGW